MERAIRATGLPFVPPSLDELRRESGRYKFCEIRTNSPAIARMAAADLLERGLGHFALCGFVECSWSLLREQDVKRKPTG
jgi:hypothetical protein